MFIDKKIRKKLKCFDFKIEYILNIIENVLMFITSFEFLYKIKFKKILLKMISNKDLSIMNFVKFKEII